MNLLKIAVIYFFFNLAILGAFFCADKLAPNLKENSELFLKLMQWLEKEKSRFGYFKKVLLMSLGLSGLLAAILILSRIPFFLKGIIAIDSWLAVVAVSYCLTDFFGYRWGGKIKVFSNLAAFLVTASWIFFPNWLTIDLAGFFFAILLLMLFVNRISLKSAMMISAAIVIYDIVNVFGTKMMQKVAVNAYALPILLIVPSDFSLSSRPFFVLGLGDVVLPGLMVMIALKKARSCSFSPFAVFTLLGYAFGLLITLAVLAVTGSPQPATIYLIPAVFASFFLAEKYYKFKTSLINFGAGVIKN